MHATNDFPSVPADRLTALRAERDDRQAKALQAADAAAAAERAGIEAARHLGRDLAANLLTYDQMRDLARLANPRTRHMAMAGLSRQDVVPSIAGIEEALNGRSRPSSVDEKLAFCEGVAEVFELI